MHIETTAGNLNAALKVIGRVVERRNMTPILGAVKIGGGRIEATNLDTHVSVTVPTIGKTKGSAAIDYRGLAALARLTPADEAVSIGEDDGLATIAFNGSEYRLASYPASDFPNLGAIAGPRSLTDNMGIVAAMRRARFAISTEETRYYLNGIAFMRREDEVFVCATDGHRLAYVPLPSAPEGCEGRIVPRDLVAFLAAQKGEPTAITFDTGKARTKIEYDGLTVAAKLIDGTYPDIWRVVPKNAAPRLTVVRDAALPALRRIAAFTDGYARAVKLTASGETLTLANERGERKAKETVAATIHGESFECGYNVHYLIEALASFREDRVTLSCAENIAAAPATLSAENDDLRIVLMPMRV